MTALTTVPKQAWRYLQGFIGLHADDVYLASFPKSGNTWVRFFFLNLVSLREWEGRAVDFGVLDRVMVELGKSNLLKEPEYGSIPRLVKTHFSRADRLPQRRTVLIVRDPRDVMVSFYKYDQKRTARVNFGDFSDQLRHPRFGLEAWYRHTESWLPLATHVLHYEALRTDDVGTFSAVLRALDIEAEAAVIEEAVRRSRFDQVRKIEEKHGISNPERYADGFKFARGGKSGAWQDYFSEEDLAYFEGVHQAHDVELYTV